MNFKGLAKEFKENWEDVVNGDLGLREDILDNILTDGDVDYENDDPCYVSTLVFANEKQVKLKLIFDFDSWLEHGGEPVDMKEFDQYLKDWFVTGELKDEFLYDLDNIFELFSDYNDDEYFYSVNANSYKVFPVQKETSGKCVYSLTITVDVEKEESDEED